MAGTVLSFGQKFVKRQSGLSSIVCQSKFSKTTMWVELYYLSVKMFLAHSMDSTPLSFDQYFA